MAQQLTMSRAAFARLLNSTYPHIDDAGPYGPFGPIIRVDRQMLNPQPLPPLAGPLPDPWFGVAAAAATIRYVLDRQELAESVGTADRVGDSLRASIQELAESVGTADRVGDSLRASIQQFVDDFCGTPPRPPRWPFPWPEPRWWTDVDELGPMDVLVAGAQFHRVAETMPDNVLATDFDAGADKLFDAGLQQLAE